MPLDADERELLESVERGEWRSTRGFVLMDIFTDDAGPQDSA